MVRRVFYRAPGKWFCRCQVTNSCHGFTLVELLVVIAIIGIHYLFFQTKAHAERIALKLQASGYTLKEVLERDGETPHGIILIGVHDVTEATMMEVSALLLEAAMEEYGVYEGWSTVLSHV